MIRFESASYRYADRERPALSATGLTLAAGRAFAVLGPNGSGKSTLLSLASGRFAPESGRVLLDDRDLRSVPRREAARRMAFLGQIERISFPYSCLEYVILGRAPLLPPLALPGEEDEEKALSALASTGMEAFARRMLTSLSGGELQLVRLARCLAQEAAIILLDEPTAMLDPRHALALARYLDRERSLGKAVLFATHDLELAAWLADEGLLLREGETTAKGRIGELLDPARLEEAYELPFRKKLHSISAYPERR